MIKILIADDAAFMRASMKMMLEQNGFKVIGEAEDGIDCVRKYKDLKPDVVTMDITMPKMTGLEALKEINEFDPKAKVVMVTAMGQENMVREAVLSGAKSFIVKPFDKEYITRTIKKVASL